MPSTEPRGRWAVPARAAAIALAVCLVTGTAQSTPALHDFRAVLPQLSEPVRAQLLARAGQWSSWRPVERERFVARVAEWDRMAPARRTERREQYAAWQTLPQRERLRVRNAAAAFAASSPVRQQKLRSRFEALDRSEQRGWLLGPALGADYAALQPLLAQVPPAQHAALLQALRGMTPAQRSRFAVLVQRTPPQERAVLRRELLSTAPSNRDGWLWQRLDR